MALTEDNWDYIEAELARQELVKDLIAEGRERRLKMRAMIAWMSKTYKAPWVERIIDTEGRGSFEYD